MSDKKGLKRLFPDEAEIDSTIQIWSNTSLTY